VETPPQEFERRGGWKGPEVLGKGWNWGVYTGYGISGDGGVCEQEKAEIRLLE
jgi:hypothetical protein